jgi:hypothetical protein
MQAETETQLRAIAAEAGRVEIGAVRPALITSNAGVWRTVWGTLVRGTNAMTNVGRDEVAAVMIDQVLKGFEKPALTNAELKSKGAELLQMQKLERS